MKMCLNHQAKHSEMLLSWFREPLGQAYQARWMHLINSGCAENTVNLSFPTQELSSVSRKKRKSTFNFLLLS